MTGGGGRRTGRTRGARGAVAVLVAGLLALVAGCSGIPGSSAAYDVAQVGDEAVPAAPLEPQAGQQPDQIVRGFVAATSRTDLDTAAGSPFGAARQYLAPDAQEAWQPAAKQVIVLAEGYRTDVDPTDPATVVVNGTQVGLLDPERSYHSQAPTPVSRTIRLAQVDGQWRISELPDELMLTSSEFSTAFRQRILYFLDPTGTVVVPDMRYIVIGQSPANRASRLLALLIRGPGPQLAGAARTQFTADSALRSNPSIDADGVLRVDLTGVDASTQEAQRALAAQVVWTLSTTSPRIAITVDGQALEPGQQIYTINTVSSFDPDRVAGTGEVASDPYFVNESGGITGLADGQPLPGELGGGESPVLTAAMSSASGVMAAVTQSAEGRQVMRLAQPRQSDRVEPVLEAGMLSQPTFSRAGDQAWVVQNGTSRPEVYRVSASGQPARERVATPGITAYGAVTALALSPDGVRAAVVAGERLWVGVIAPAPPDGGLDSDVPPAPASSAAPPPPDAGGSPAAPTPDGSDEVTTVQPLVMLTDLVEIRPDLVRVGAIAWSNSRQLVVAATTSPSSFRTVWEVSLDGYEARNVTTRGMFGDVESVAVATGQPILVGFSGRVWQLQGSLTDGQWLSPLPDQPFLTGTSPFYPS